jgi:hypothetical protein
MLVLVKIATQMFETVNFILTHDMTIAIVNSTLNHDSILNHDSTRIVSELVNTKSQNIHSKIFTQ